jgi:nitrite reductase/ring-hydroxylating ferredoxin subunit
MRIVPIGRFGVGVYNVGGRFYALNNYCPHRGAKACLGPVGGEAVAKDGYQAGLRRDGEILRCPWHGWEYEIATGRALVRPRKSIRSYPVTVQDGMILVEDD